MGEFLLKTNRRDVQIMGYDMVERNAKCLRLGSISFLIAQHAFMQGYNCVDTLFKAIVLKKKGRSGKLYAYRACFQKKTSTFTEELNYNYNLLKQIILMEKAPFIKINRADTVVVCLKNYTKGEVVNVDGKAVTVAQDTPVGHKILITDTPRRNRHHKIWLSDRPCKKKISRQDNG